MARAISRNFFGGIDQLSDPTKLDESHYYLLVNARTRRNTARAIKIPKDYTSGLPAGTIQGLYAFSTYAVVFISGEGYYRDFSSGGNWNKIVGLSLSAAAPRIYLEPIPSSYMNLGRTLDAGNIVFTAPRNSSQSCALVTDGVNQPWVILPDATARVTKGYGGWTQDDPEYVPIGILPRYINGVLYMIGKDAYGKYNQIYRSVTGRPLNFVIAITPAGDQIDPAESVGGAPTMAYRVDFDDVTCIQTVNAVDGSFVVTTAKNSYLVTPNLNNLIYGEPTFTNQFLFSIGALNQESLVDASGDTALIHYSGIRSFNGTSQYRFEGKNTPFSAPINDLLTGITQSTTAAVSFDNYCAFSLTTKYGKAVAWYDTINQSWTAIDLFPGIGLIKQFAQLISTTDRRLLFYTEDNHLYEYFAGDTYATAMLYSREYLPSSDVTEQSVDCVTASFSNISGELNAVCIPIIDRVFTSPQVLNFSPTDDFQQTGYAAVPFNPQVDATNVLNFPFNFGGTPTPYGQRLGVFLMWSGDCDLISYTLELNEKQEPLSNTAQSTTFSQVTPDVIIFIGNDGVDNATRESLNTAILAENPDLVVGAGGHAYTAGSLTDVSDRLITYWQWAINAGKAVFAPGGADYDTSAGAPFFTTLHQSPDHYFKKSLNHTNIFLLSSGYDSGGSQVESANNPSIAAGPQATWLANTIDNTAFNVIVAHDPFYSSVGDATRMAAMRTLDVSQAHLVVNARSLLYERFNVNNKTFLTVGTGGAGLDTVTTVAANSACISRTYGYVKATVYPLHAELEYKDINGTILDRAFITR